MSALFTGVNLLELSTIDSTNNYAQQLIRSGNFIEGTIVWAHEQTEGRGQRGKSWDSKQGDSLTFSLLYRPVFLSATWQFRLSMAVALGIVDTLNELTNEQVFKIKWPNDIYYGDKKVAGILIENSMQQGLISSSVIGIGLNVNQQAFDPELPNPTSLALCLGRGFELKELLLQLCDTIERRYLQLKADRIAEIQEEYTSKLFKLGQQVKFLNNDAEIVATIKGVNPQGKLVLEDATGKTTDYGLNELTMLL